MHVLLFDIDGTLIHAGGAGRTALREALSSEFGLQDPEVEVDFAGRTDRFIATELLRRNGLEPEEEVFARLFQAYLHHLPQALAAHRGRVMRGVPVLLEELSSRDDTVLGILTGNFERAAFLKLAHFGLRAYFQLGGYGDHHESRDDVARAARQAVNAQLRDRHPSWQLWVVGDTPLDVQCARAIGARVVAVGSGFASLEDLAAAEPDYLFRDLADPSRLLGLLGGFG